MTEALDYSSAPRTLNRRLVAAVHLTALVSPLLLVAGFYGAWVLAWFTLGHRPRPSLDDPSDVLGAAYYASGLPVLFGPVGAIVGLCSIVLLALTHRLHARVLLWTMVLAALWAGAIGLARWDPLQVVNWWFD
jgi:hypothetical protein